MTSSDRKSVTTFQWQIENFSFFHREIHGDNLTSPQFICTSFQGNNLCLVVFPKGLDDTDQHVRVRLHPIRLRFPVNVDCEVSFLDNNKSPLVTLIAKNLELKQDIPLDLPPGPILIEVYLFQKISFLLRDTLTLRCQISRSKVDGQVNEHYFARTRIEIRETFFVWPKKCFRKLELDKSATVSLLLTLFPRDFLSLKWKQTLTGSSLEDSKLEFEIGEVSNVEKLLLKCKLSLLNRHQETVTFKEDECIFGLPSRSQTWSLPSFLRQELLDKDIRALSLSINAITSHVSETIQNTVRTPAFLKYPRSSRCRNRQQSGTSSIDAIQHKVESTTALVNNFISMFLDHTLSDFKIQAEGISFPVHKNILCARSPVFRSFIMEQKDCDSMDIEDLDATTLNMMLKFMYGGNIDILDCTNAAKLCYAARQYQIPSLEDECFFILRSSIAVSNVCEILVLADQHKDKELLSISQHFIYDFLDDVVSSNEWAKFVENDPDLAIKTLEIIQNRKLLNQMQSFFSS